MNSTRRYLSTTLYAVFLIFAIGCLYFAISEGMFAWLYPDELLASIWSNHYGILGCTKYYYAGTFQGHRVGEVFGVCLAAHAANMFSALFMGWAFVRLCFYALIPISMAFLLKEIVNLPLKFAFIVAFILSGIALFILFSLYAHQYIFALDLAAYAAMTFTFFALIALFPKSIESKRHFIWFCLFFAANISCHELFLLISGFFIPLYAYYRYAFTRRADHRRSLLGSIKGVLRDRRIQVLLAIYFVIALIMVLAPQLHSLSNMPAVASSASGTFLDGMAYLILSTEHTIRLMLSYYLLVIFVLLLGVSFGMSGLSKYFPKKKLLYVLIFCAPLFYLAVTGFLIGTHPFLWAPSPFPLITRSLASHFAFANYKSILTSGAAIPMRQSLFLYVSLFLNIFLAGFLIASAIRRRLKNDSIKKIWPFKFILFSAVAVLFLFNPDGVGSTEVLTALVKGDSDIQRSFQKNKKALREGSIIQSIFPSSSTIHALGDMIFPRLKLADHGFSITGIRVSNYLKAHRGKAISDRAYNLVLDPMRRYVAETRDPWIGVTYARYGVFPNKPCVLFLNERKMKGSHCSSAYINKKVSPNVVRGSRFTGGIHASLSMQKKLMAIDFARTVGMKMKKHANCMQLSEIPTKNEHFIASNDLHLSKGFYYFIFEAKPTQISLFLYLIRKNGNFLLPWLNQRYGLVGVWSNMSKSNFIEPIFSQVEASAKLVKLRVVLYSAMDQTMHFRWQHGYLGPSNYKGNKENVSSICGAWYKKISGKSIVLQKQTAQK